VLTGTTPKNSPYAVCEALVLPLLQPPGKQKTIYDSLFFAKFHDGFFRLNMGVYR
jgi:hypothetical protein